MEDGVKIRNIESLRDFSNLIAFTGESVTTIIENVSNYIDGVNDVLEKQLELLREELEKAEKELEKAERALSDCEDSQEYDEEAKEYRPSCSCERGAVESAWEIVSQCRSNVKAGEQILYECKTEINDYKFSGSIIEPPGGHCLMEYMAQTQTPKIVEQMHEYIGHAEDVLTMDLGGDVQDVQVISNPNVTEEDLPMSENERVNRFKVNIQEEKQNQANNAQCWNLADANRAMRCPNCGRPLQLCICNNLHADIKIYSK